MIINNRRTTLKSEHVSNISGIHGTFFLFTITAHGLDRSSSSVMRRYELLQIQSHWNFILFFIRGNIYIYLFVYFTDVKIQVVFKRKIKLGRYFLFKWRTCGSHFEYEVIFLLDRYFLGHPLPTWHPEIRLAFAGSFWAPNLGLWPLIASLTVLIG